jgi:hypothetical protein
VVLDEINLSSSPLLQPLKLLANYLSQPAKRDAIVVDLDAQVSHISFTDVCNRAVRDLLHTMDQISLKTPNPDPRIHASDKWIRIRILLFSSLTFKTPTKN